jgi:hypothetical protein
MPKQLQSAQCLDEFCPRCLQKTKSQVKLFKLKMKAEGICEKVAPLLTLDYNTSGKFCVLPGCDPNYSVLMENLQWPQN